MYIYICYSILHVHYGALLGGFRGRRVAQARQLVTGVVLDLKASSVTRGAMNEAQRSQQND